VIQAASEVRKSVLTARVGAQEAPRNREALAASENQVRNKTLAVTTFFAPELMEAMDGFSVVATVPPLLAGPLVVAAEAATMVVVAAAAGAT
jgi:hypothetical protein